MVGRTVAQEVARRDYADVVIVDIVDNLPQGIALDINEAGTVLGYDAMKLMADAVRRAFVEEPSPETPASLVRAESGRTAAILDRAAAAAIAA